VQQWGRRQEVDQVVLLVAPWATKVVAVQIAVADA